MDSRAGVGHFHFVAAGRIWSSHAGLFESPGRSVIHGIGFPPFIVLVGLDGGYEKFAGSTTGITARAVCLSVALWGQKKIVIGYCGYKRKRKVRYDVGDDQEIIASVTSRR
jgi:hypothetical protein